MSKTNRTRRYIADAFLELSETHSLKKISVRMLCDHLDINRSTFYYHFTSIQDLIHWIYSSEVNEPVREQIRSGPDYQPRISSDALGNIYKRRDFWLKVLRLPSGEEFESFMLADTMKNWQLLIMTMLSEQGIDKDNLTEHQKTKLDYLISYYCAAHLNVTLLWMKQGMKQPPEEFAQIIDNIAAKGFFSGFDSIITNISAN